MTIPKIKEVSDALELIKERIVLVNDQLLWKDTGNPVEANKNKNLEYLKFDFSGFQFYYHRVVFFLHSGLWPDMVDHKDGDTFNNHPSNLRAATASQNSMNRRRAINNTSGYKGVTYRKDIDKYTARIQFGGKTRSLGFYNSAEEAGKAYDIAATLLFNEFANVNTPDDIDRLMALAKLRIVQQDMIEQGYAPELVY